MDKKNENRRGSPAKKEARFINRNIVVFAFFLLLSFLFWYLNSLGKDQEVDIRYPVRYINLPGNRQFEKEPPEKLNLYLRGPGYSILRLKYSGNRAPAVVDLFKTGYKRSSAANQGADYYLLTSDLTQEINSQLKSECKIISIKPDTLFFSFTQSSR